MPTSGILFPATRYVRLHLIARNIFHRAYQLCRNAVHTLRR